MTLYSSRNKKSEIAFFEAMKQAGIEVILTDFPWGEYECMVNTTEHDKEIRNKTIEEFVNHVDGLKSIGRFCYESIKGILNQMKEGGENG